MTPQLHQALDWVADSIDPLLALVALAAPAFHRPLIARRIIVYYVCGGIAVAMVYVIRALDARYQVWAAAGLDFSTHTAFAASIGTSLVWLYRRWLLPVAMALTLNFSLILILRYHSILDVVSSAPLAASIAALLHVAGARGARISARGPEPAA